MAILTLNNADLSFGNIWYVDSTNGVDNILRTGTKYEPFKTINWTSQNKASDGDCIFALEGTYDVTYTLSLDTYGSGGLYNYGKNLTFIGVPNKTFFITDGRKHTFRDQTILMPAKDKTITTYNIIFKNYVNARTNFYSANIAQNYAGVTATTKATAYNCVFDFVDATASTGCSGSYGQVTLTTNNCVIKCMSNMTVTGTGVTNFVNTACAKNLAPAGTTSLNNAIFDVNWNITSTGWINTGTGLNPDGSKSNIGLYGGNFYWDCPTINSLSIVTPPENLGEWSLPITYPYQVNDKFQWTLPTIKVYENNVLANTIKNPDYNTDLLIDTAHLFNLLNVGEVGTIRLDFSNGIYEISKANIFTKTSAGNEIIVQSTPVKTATPVFQVIVNLIYNAKPENVQIEVTNNAFDTFPTWQIINESELSTILNNQKTDLFWGFSIKVTIVKNLDEPIITLNEISAEYNYWSNTLKRR